VFVTPLTVRGPQVCKDLREFRGRRVIPGLQELPVYKDLQVNPDKRAIPEPAAVRFPFLNSMRSKSGLPSSRSNK
jgi:hypothetical protein